MPRLLLTVVVFLAIGTMRNDSGTARAAGVNRYVGPCGQGCARGAADADVVIGALLNVHTWNETTSSCSDDLSGAGQAWQWSEALRFGVDQINAMPNLLPGLTLGYDMRDTCSNPQRVLKVTVEFVSDGSKSDDCSAIAPFENTTLLLPTSSTVSSPGQPTTQAGRPHMPVPAIIGPFDASQTLDVAGLTALFQMPLISFSASGLDLGVRCNYPFFTRTLPTDIEEVFLAVELALRLGWTYVSFVYSNDAYGREAFKVFSEQIKNKSVCLAAEIKLDSDKPEAYYDGQVEKLLRNTTNEPFANARIAMTFSTEGVLKHFFEAAMRVNESFAGRNWIVAGRAITLLLNNQDILSFVVGAFSLSNPTAFQEVKFENYVKSLIDNTHNITAYTSNPWTIETVRKGGQLKFNRTSSALTSPFSSYMREAVFAFAHAMNATLTKLCSDIPSGGCSNIKQIVEEHRRTGRRINGTSLQKELEEVTFVTPILPNASKLFQLDSITRERLYTVFGVYTSLLKPDSISLDVILAGNGWMEYNQSTNSSERFNNDPAEGPCDDIVNLYASTTLPVIELRPDPKIQAAIRAKEVDGQPFESVCSRPCPGGMEPVGLNNGHARKCCWTCVPCKQNFYSSGNKTHCKPCNDTEKAAPGSVECVTLALKNWDLELPEAIALVILASIVLAINLVLIALSVLVFEQHRKKNKSASGGVPPLRWPLGRASLTFTSLFGCLLLAIVSFTTIAEPTTVGCSAIVVLFFVAFTLLAVSVLANSVHRNLQRRIELGLRQQSVLGSFSSNAGESVSSTSSQTSPSRLTSARDPDTPVSPPRPVSVQYTVGQDRTTIPALSGPQNSYTQLQAVMFVMKAGARAPEHQDSRASVFTYNSIPESSAPEPKPKVQFREKASQRLSRRRLSRKASAAIARRLRALPLSTEKDTSWAVLLGILLSVVLAIMGIAQSPSRPVREVYAHSRYLQYCDAEHTSIIAASIAPMLFYVLALVCSLDVVLLVKNNKKTLRSEDISPAVFLCLWLFLYIVMLIIHAASPNDYQSAKLWSVTGRQCFAMLLVALAMNTVIHIPSIASILMRKEEDVEASKVSLIAYSQLVFRRNQNWFCSWLGCQAAF